MSHDHDHGHHSFLAHHFDDPEQQFDSGKLGIWLFLVTEVLFFSGMFCAYALYRARNPEVFTFASQFLNSSLGAINTGVLLFSSLSMAWAVRCAQLRQRTGLVIALAVTLGCASMFLGVKAVEYTHKWDLGLLPGGDYVPQYSVVGHHEGLPTWLTRVSLVPGLCVIAFAAWYVISLVQKKSRAIEISGSLLVTALCYFGGVFLGIAIESAAAEAHAGGHHGEHSAGEHHDGGHHDEGHADGEHHEGEHAGEDGHGSDGELGANGGTASASITKGLLVAAEAPLDGRMPGEPTIEMVDQPGAAGLFFSIYYCMTGVHAVHILGGMAVLAWLLVRATRDEFHSEYFGPVDYVGLYWHLVDLIWIYLFPLLYLIT